MSKLIHKPPERYVHKINNKISRNSSSKLVISSMIKYFSNLPLSNYYGNTNLSDGNT